MTALRITIALACMALGFLAGAWAFGNAHPETCARVPNGIVCWHGMTGAEWSVR